MEFSLSPGVTPLSLLSVSEVWPAPFLMGSSSDSPFSSGAAGFPSASGLLAGAAAAVVPVAVAVVELKPDGSGAGLLLLLLLLGGADCRDWSPAG